ncbi:MAG: TolC family protein [Rikenellaceae bacterium]
MKLSQSILGLFLLLPIPLEAQVQHTLTLEQAMEQTLGENKQIDIDHFAEQSMLYKRKAMKGLHSPQFGLVAAYSHLSDDIKLDVNGLKPTVGGLLANFPATIIPPEVAKSIMGKDWAYKIQDKDFLTIGATVSMPIFMGGKINAANRAAQAELDIAKEEGNQNKAALRSELIERYYGLSLAMQALEVRTEVLEGMEKHLADALKLEKNGIVPKVDCLYAQMKVAEAAAEVQKAKSALKTITTALKNTLNQPNYEGDIFPMSSMFVLKNIEDLNYFKDLALKNNSILKQIDLKTQLAKEALKVERSAFMPEIAAMGGVALYNYQVTTFAPKWMVGAGLKFNIFDGLHRENSVRSAKSKVNQVKAIGENAESDIEMLIEKLYNELLSTKDVYDTFASRIDFAKEYLRLKEIAFSNGMAPSQDVTDARLLLSKNRIEALQSAFDYDIALSKLLENCGISEEFMQYKNSINYIPVYYTHEK